MIRINFGKRRAYAGGEEAWLARGQWNLLEYLYYHRGRCVSESELSAHHWGESGFEWTACKWEIRNLRRLLPGIPIFNKRGQGYILEDQGIEVI